MSYYFVIVGTRDNPLYTADLASKPTSSGPTSFFSSSSSSASSTRNTILDNEPSTPSTPTNPSGSTGGGGGLFGFGGALGALAGGLSSSSANPPQQSRNNTQSMEGKGIGFGRYNDKHVLQMIAHSSLDVVEDKQFANNAMYMKAVDRINEWTTSAFLIPGNVKLLILHEHRHDDGIRNFFLDVWELWIKLIRNPFHDINAPIASSSFDAKVKASARKHL
ncbi:unnamed protein product [Sympodiomycopsis kandeliae]